MGQNLWPRKSQLSPVVKSSRSGNGMLWRAKSVSLRRRYSKWMFEFNSDKASNSIELLLSTGRGQSAMSQLLRSGCSSNIRCCEMDNNAKRRHRPEKFDSHPHLLLQTIYIWLIWLWLWINIYNILWNIIKCYMNYMLGWTSIYQLFWCSRILGVDSYPHWWGNSFHRNTSLEAAKSPPEACGNQCFLLSVSMPSVL